MKIGLFYANFLAAKYRSGAAPLALDSDAIWGVGQRTKEATWSDPYSMNKTFGSIRTRLSDYAANREHQDWVYRVALTDDDGNVERWLSEPVVIGRDQAPLLNLKIEDPNKPEVPPEPDWVPGEEEEEALHAQT